MAQCHKCKLFVSTNKDDILKCRGACETVWHKKCVRKLKKFEQRGLCDNCQINESNSPIPPPTLDVDLSETSAQNILSELNKKLGIIHKMEKTLEEMKTTIDFYAEQYQEMVEFKQKAEKKFTALEQKNTHLEKCNKALEERIQELEQREKENNVEIFGLEKRNNEVIMNVVKNIAQKLSLNSTDIIDAVRVGKENEDKNKPQPVIVTLRNKQTRNAWIAKRKTVFTNGQIYNNDSAKRIYINDDLPKFKRQLLWETKDQLKSIFSYIWVQDYNILVKKDSNEKKIYKIRSQDDIKILRKNC